MPLTSLSEPIGGLAVGEAAARAVHVLHVAVDVHVAVADRERHLLVERVLDPEREGEAFDAGLTRLQIERHEGLDLARVQVSKSSGAVQVGIRRVLNSPV